MIKEFSKIESTREAEVKKEGETKLFYIAPEKEGTQKPEIMIGARDIGAARCLAPVVEELIKRGYPISLLTDKPAEDFLKKKFTAAKEIEIESSLEAVAERQPSLILSSISESGVGGPGIEFYLAKTAEGYGSRKEIKSIPSVWVEDFWGMATFKKHLSYAVKPNVVCAFDEHSKALNIKNLKDAGIKDWSPEQFIVTGSPAFDELAQKKDREKIRNNVREKLGIKEKETLVSYIGDAPPDDLKNFKIFIDSFNKLKLKDQEIKLTTRIHPRIFVDKTLSRYKEEHKKILDKFNNGEVVDTMSKFSTDEINIAADVIVSSHSTEGVKAVYCNKVSLFMLLPKLGLEALKKSVGMNTLPIIETGASIGVFKKGGMVSALEKALDKKHQEELRKAQRKYHNLDGKNTEKVVEVIEKILRI